MQIHENISLKRYNSFGIDVKARQFASFKDTDDLSSLLTPNSRLPTPDSRPPTPDSQLPTLILGGGTNILLTKDFDGLVLKNEITGIKEIHEDNDYVFVKAGAGENWHRFVLYCIQRNWAGVENLSLIPGNVGASPIQNIGAYGVELEDVFWDLEAYHIKEKKLLTFTRNDCKFGYRDSVFKKELNGQLVILNVTFKLHKKPVFHTSYGAIVQELEKMGVKKLSIKAISDAVIRIRSSKLPDPAKMGNAGSFFKNPEISPDQFSKLQEDFPSIEGHLLLNEHVKLSAAWLIEQCGWKGFRLGDAGCHANQALVLVNYGHAKGDEIYNLSEEILQSVNEKFDITLEREVNIL